MATTRKRILVVDDDEVVLKALTIKLNAKGYDVLTERDLFGVLTLLGTGTHDTKGCESMTWSNGHKNVSDGRTAKPDLILLDLGFPSEIDSVPWDGFLIMEWLKRLDDAAKIPIIIITGADPAQYEEKAKATGAIGFFRKPVDHKVLFDTIQKVLAEDRSAA